MQIISVVNSIHMFHMFFLRIFFEKVFHPIDWARLFVSRRVSEEEARRDERRVARHGGVDATGKTAATLPVRPHKTVADSNS